ncbi:S49 family peptidase [Sphingobium sp. YG1]|uniref:S49 family peptidase n=1 Tax=Sphingobium sp. YG1 TaxID=2082188 RepID=UPI000DBB7AB8|nr:S49 family peptidase [Sphingobium sp. YG1]BBD01846.1 hypothetical protein YGS_C1P3101 [Sphingobium sp. YG1]
MARAFSLVDISERAFNRPVMITPEKAQIILGVIGPRLNVGQLIVAGEDGAPVPIQSLAQRAAGARFDMEPMPGDDRIAARDWNTGAVVDPYETWMGAAVIKVRGTLMAENGLNPSSGATGYDGLLYKARYAHADPKVKGLLLDIDSPGGEVVDLMEFCQQLLAIREDKPIRAIVRGCAASAGYAIACCASPGQITAAPYSMVGSIGALMMHADWSKNLEQEGIAVTLITSAAHKADGSSVMPLAADVQERLQTSVNACASAFIDHVAQARPVMSRDAIVAQEARFYTGDDARSQQLVDKFMTWDESLREFSDILNGSGNPGRAARPGAPGAQTSKGTSMSTSNPAPGDDTPVHTDAQMQTAVASATMAAVTAERERFAQLCALDSDSTISDGLNAAITDGTSAGEYAIGLATAAKAATATALETAKNEAASGEQLPGKSASRASGQGQKVSRGKAIMDRYAGKHPSIPAR